MARDHDELPLPDFDHVLIGHLPSRIASLDKDDIAKLIAYEEAHAHRLPILMALKRRLDALAAGATVAEGGGDDPSMGGGVGGGSKVSGTSRKAGGGGRATLKVNPGGH